MKIDKRKLGRKGNLNGNWKGGKNIQVCKYCKIDFYSYKTNNKIFCSKECYHNSSFGVKRPNISISLIKAHKNKDFGYKKGELMGEKNYAKLPYIRKKISIKNIQLRCNMPKNETSIELEFKNLLLQNNIPFIFQYNFNNKFAVDFAIPEKKIIIEVDGEYWHNYPEGTKKDKSRDKYINACGWKVIRFWGNDIKSNSNKCLEIMQNVIK